MELKDFVARTLVEIVEGVRSAQEQASKIDARINPTLGPTQARSRRIVQVEFNVAISEISGTATTGRIGVLAGIVGATTAGKSRSDRSAATTVRFSVPVVLPTESDMSRRSG